MIDSEETLETHDIQGLVLRGYGPLVAARFLLLEVNEGHEDEARAYLQRLCGRINLARDSPGTVAIQVAFTARGLERLGVPPSALNTFSREFLEGMDDDIRSETLGDRGDNDPSTWEWGRRTDPVHVLLMVYARNAATLESVLLEERVLLSDGFRVLHEKETAMLPDQKEHFGWRDGLSMPKIAGVPNERPRKKKQESWTHPLPPGEFVLGYRNDYGVQTPLPALGRNGTYLVYREMTQDVFGFWEYLARSSREPGDDAAGRAIALGAKMVGRWPGGAPLVTSPDGDRPEHASENAFVYQKDVAGVRCPAGAHIRRANPRDVVAGDRGHEESLMMVRKHQMVRRGRAFGRPVSPTMNPREIIAARPDDERRGLHFICLVGDIARQFEFVQRAWIHSANFAAQCRDGDPIASARRPHGHENANNEFTCPADPVRRKYKQVPQFTRLVGGAYFFLPGIAALRVISRHPGGA